jgi:hypothetical protein
MSGPVPGFMTHCAVPVDRLEVNRRRRRLDKIGAWDIERAIAANAQIGAGGGDQRLGLRQDQLVSNRCRQRREVGRKILALVGVEDREVLEERNGFGFVAGFRRARSR